MKKIKLTQGKFALVDDSDSDYLSQWKWRYFHKNYAVRWETGKTMKTRKYILMHRKILNTPKGMETDHINGNGLDNCRKNLRAVTRQQNTWNSSVNKYKKYSNYKGMTWNKRKKKWQVYCKGEYIGYFQTEHQAALAYDLWAIDQFGQFARTNFKSIAHTKLPPKLS